jgi:hypothetical protein
VNPAAKVFGLPDSGFFVDYPSNKTGNNDYTTNIKAVVELANHGEVPLPNDKCMAANPTNPHFCLMAEHLMHYITTPMIVVESLYDTWQLAHILQIPCTMGYWPPDLNKCNKDEMVEIEKFKAYTVNALKAAYDLAPMNRTIWSPSCPFHGFSHFGEVDDPQSKNYVSPVNTTNTLGEVSHWLIFANMSGNFIDTVSWPDNGPCSLKTSESAKLCPTNPEN